MGDGVSQFLVDTHTLLWWLSNQELLSTKANAVLRDPRNTLLVSAATAWELAIKVKAGKLKISVRLNDVLVLLEEAGFLALPITLDHAVRAGALPEHHRDPFDRMLIAQAQAEGLAVLSNDRLFDPYGVKRIW
jgi:PIN domain nuclease of toxin-antitoxin system